MAGVSRSRCPDGKWIPCERLGSEAYIRIGHRASAANVPDGKYELKLATSRGNQLLGINGLLLQARCQSRYG